jgi:hypothetical protein
MSFEALGWGWLGGVDMNRLEGGLGSLRGVMAVRRKGVRAGAGPGHAKRGLCMRRSSGAEQVRILAAERDRSRRLRSHYWSQACVLLGPAGRLPTSFLSASMASTRFSVLSSGSLSSAELLSPTGSTGRFSLPSAPSITTAVGPSKPLVRPNIYDRPPNKIRTTEVSASAFAFLFSEIVQYTQKRVSGINDFERRYAFCVNRITPLLAEASY